MPTEDTTERVPDMGGEGEAQIPPEGAKETEQAVPNVAQLQADLKQEREAREKAERDRDNYRSQQIATLKVGERDALLQELLDRQDLIAQSLNDENLQAKLKEKQDALFTKQRAEVFSKAQSDAWTQIQTIGAELKLDMNTAPEFDATRTYWNAAFRENNLSFFDKALAEAERAARKIERGRAMQETEKAKKTATSEVQKKLKEAGVSDLALPSGGAAPANRPISRKDIEEYDITTKTTKELMADADKILDQMYSKKGR